jgi:hypothetical protein
MGTVNDVVIDEINKQYGDVNVVHLTKCLQNSLSLRSCRINCIRQKGKHLAVISQISERVSWANDLDDAITAVKSLKDHLKTAEKNPVPPKPQGVCKPSKSKAEQKSEGEKQEPKEFMIVKKEPDLEVSGRMVRRQIERSAYYRPTIEKNMF